MRACSVLVLACLAATAGGCGDDGKERAQRPPAPVDLRVTAPADMATVRAESVEVQGTVEPAGAAVLVLGQRAPVSGGGTFRAKVPLEPGANVIDVMATAPRRGPALTAFRVTREVLVSVPELDGKAVADAEQTLRAAGLGIEVEQDGGLIEELLPGEPAVCEQDPGPGTQVRRGTRVHVVVSKTC
jgi:hypothetical protein